MVKTKTTSSMLAAAAAAAAVTATSTSTTTTGLSRRSDFVAAASCRQPVARAPSFGLPDARPPALFLPRLLQIPRGGDDDAATRDDNNMEEEQPSSKAENATTTASPAASASSSGKKKKKRTRKKENALNGKVENNVPTDEKNDASGNGDERNASKKKNEPAKPKQAASYPSSPEGGKPQEPPPSTGAAAAPNPAPSATPPKRSPIVEQILKEDDYYKILGIVNRPEIEKLSSSSQGDNDMAASIITKHYRKRALQTHPDKTGGDRRAFDKVAEAYDVLSDPDKRNVYNRFGKKGLDSTGSMGGAGFGAAGSATRHAEELFRSFFGGTGNPFFQQPQQQQQTRSNSNRTARYQLPVTLEDLYRGMTRNVIVAPPAEEEETMIFGNMIYRRPKPPRSSPQKQKSKTVQVHIPRGALNGQNIVMSGEMDFDATQTPGDIVFSLATRPHAIFTRKGHDLALQHTISLRQALCGQPDDVVLIRHLNGQDIPLHLARRTRRDKTSTSSTSSISLSSSQQEQEEAEQPCMMIHDGDVQVVKGLGMPKDALGTAFGDLYIQFKVEMPSSSSLAKKKPAAKKANDGEDNTELTLQERQELRRLLDKLLGSSSSASDTSASSRKSDNRQEAVYIMQKAKLSDFGHASGKPQMPSSSPHDDHHADDDDDDDERYHQGNPFEGAGASQFFFSSMMGGPGGRASNNPFFRSGLSSFSSNPFEEHGYPHDASSSQDDDHDENAQCRQM